MLSVVRLLNTNALPALTDLSKLANDTNHPAMQRLAAKLCERAGGELRPVATGDFGNREQRTPVVAQTIMRRRWHLGPGILNGVEVFFGPAGKLLVERGFESGVGFVEP